MVMKGVSFRDGGRHPEVVLLSVYAPTAGRDAIVAHGGGNVKRIFHIFLMRKTGAGAIVNFL